MKSDHVSSFLCIRLISLSHGVSNGLLPSALHTLSALNWRLTWTFLHISGILFFCTNDLPTVKVAFWTFGSLGVGEPPPRALGESWSNRTHCSFSPFFFLTLVISYIFVYLYAQTHIHRMTIFSYSLTFLVILLMN